MEIINTYTSREVEKKVFLSPEDSKLIDTFNLPSSFDLDQDKIELHFYTLADSLLKSDYQYKNFRVSVNSISNPKNLTELTIDPEKDAILYGLEEGDVKLVYNFLRTVKDSNNNSDFFIKQISPDRTEIAVGSVDISEDEIINVFDNLKNEINTSQYTENVVLNFSNNVLLSLVNIESYTNGNEQIFAIKTYLPIPDEIGIKDLFTIDRIVSDSVEFLVQRETSIKSDPTPQLRGPNFNIEAFENFTNPTELLNTATLLSTLTGSNYLNFSETEEISLKLNVDYSNFENFIHFSSAEERLRNFKYKLELLESYEISRSLAESIKPSSQATSSIASYNTLIEGVLKNFDNYEKYLYFESHSNAWPKSNNTPPYINLTTSSPSATSFFNDKIESSSFYDLNNDYRLLNYIPKYLRENENNESLNLFVDMLGQHFDNLWIYTKGVTTRLKAENKINEGISKDLVGEALKNLGIKLYSDNTSFESLFSMFTGEYYQTGSELVNTFVTSSLIPVSKENYKGELLKRIYHNVPLLLKSKGTERGIKALITSFGIPSSFLQIRYSGGINSEILPFSGPFNTYSGSLSRIRTDNTGSIVEGNTLSYYTSIIKKDNKYTEDLHTLELGFSPSNYINDYIIENNLLGSNYDLDNYIGDPGHYYSGSYEALDKFAEQAMSGYFNRYNVYDLIRLVKFYSNTLFKMVKDFVPARTNLATGVIIKPYILNRSKVKRTKVEANFADYSGSIRTGFIRGSSSGALRGTSTLYNTGFIYFTPLPSGSFGLKRVTAFEPNFTGELSGSLITLTDGELNRNNLYKKGLKEGFSFRIRPLNEIVPETGFSVTVTHISP